jgi:hypothetical protein
MAFRLKRKHKTFVFTCFPKSGFLLKEKYSRLTKCHGRPVRWLMERCREHSGGEISPQRKIMNESNILWFSIIVSVVGIAMMGGIIFFGTFLFKRSMNQFPLDYPFWEHFLHRFDQSPARAAFARYLADAYGDFLQRRNEFWTTYGQLLTSVLIIIVLTILLLTKTISAEAGLPILSGISGFAIAKGAVASSRTPATPPEKEQG